MPVDFSETLVVAVSARALFDLEAEATLYRERGLDAYAAHQRANEGKPLAPGPAFHLVRGLLALNGGLADGTPAVEVVVVSSQHPDTGLRILNSIHHHALAITRAAFTGGAPVAPLLPAFQVDLLLTRSPSDAQAAVDVGIAAATMYDLPGGYPEPDDEHPLVAAFDGDAVLFSDESEALYRQHGIAAFAANEVAMAHVPLPEGPMGKLLRSMARVRDAAPGNRRKLLIALVTARNGPAHERALRTLRAWGIGCDQAYFLGGMPKAPVLKAIGAWIFFDDQDAHCGPASRVVPSARVPYLTGSVLHVGVAA